MSSAELHFTEVYANKINPKNDSNNIACLGAQFGNANMTMFDNGVYRAQNDCLLLL